MKSNNQGWLSKVLMLTISAFMLLSVSAVTASAQDRDHDKNWRRNEQRREELQQREAIRRQQEIQRQQILRQQQYGYYGNNGYYNNGYYRNNGVYNNGYNNVYGYNNNFTQTALNAGYNAGIQEGRRDRSRGGYRDLNSFSEFRSADKDYNSRLGDRYTYQQYYRQGFQNGYRDGLNGY
jgi:hypothetical protein